MGHEQQGSRYAIVLQSNDLAVLSTWLVAPTSTAANPASFRPTVRVMGSQTRVLVEQTAAVTPTRLGRKVGHLRHGEMEAIDAALITVLDLPTR